MQKPNQRNPNQRAMSDANFDAPNPMIDLDPETLDTSQGISDNLGNEGEVELERSHYVRVSASVLRNERGLEITGIKCPSKYAGRIVSRSDLAVSDSEESICTDASGDFNVVSSRSALDGSEGSRDSEWSEPEAFGAVSDDASHEQVHGIPVVPNAHVSDSDKGRHIQAQMDITDALLDLRIRLQKVVALVNTLPPADQFEAISQSTRPTSDGSVLELANELALMHDTMTGCHPELGALVSACSLDRKRKRHVDGQDLSQDELWDSFCVLNSMSEPWLYAAMDKWNEKINATAGLQIHSAKKFKVINQSISHQIEQTTARDHDRLVKRTQLKRFPHAILSLLHHELPPQASDSGTSGHERKLLIDELDERCEVPTSARAARHVYIPHIYDDMDLYSVLLKETIDRKLVHINVLPNAHRQSVIKPTVDTRASKGRKLRFHVHSQLANWMAPTSNVPRYRPANVSGSTIVGRPRGAISNVDGDEMSVGQKWTDSMIDELFASLFGNADATSVQRIHTDLGAKKRAESTALQRQVSDSKNGQIRLFG